MSLASQQHKRGNNFSAYAQIYHELDLHGTLGAIKLGDGQHVNRSNLTALLSMSKCAVGDLTALRDYSSISLYTSLSLLSGQ